MLLCAYIGNYLLIIEINSNMVTTINIGDTIKKNCTSTERSYNLWILNKNPSVCVQKLLIKTENNKINHGIYSIAQGFKIRCFNAIYFVYKNKYNHILIEFNWYE